MPIVFREAVREALQRRNDDIAELPTGPDSSVLVSARTGRVFGPYFGEADPIGWVLPGLLNLARGQFEGDWNLGGERLWLSPELEYFVADRERFWESYSVPPAIDPGHYSWSTLAPLTLCSCFGLTSARTGELQAVAITRCFTAKPAVTNSPGIMASRYQQYIEVTSEAEKPPVVPWLIRQVQTGGSVILPVSGAWRAATLVGKAPHLDTSGLLGAVRMALEPTGPMFKIGFAADKPIPLLGYLRTDERKSVAIIMRFDHDPRASYHEEPPARPGDVGYASMVFKDDNRFGGYGELELLGRTVERTRALKVASLSVDTTVLMGEAGTVQALFLEQLGLAQNSVTISSEGFPK